MPGVSGGPRAARPAAVLAAVLAAACSSPGEPTVEPQHPTVALLYGAVSGPGGTPAAGTRVRGYASEQQGAGCAADVLAEGFGDTNAAGGFRFGIGGPPFRARIPVCVTVIVRPPAGSGLREDTVSGLRMTMVREDLGPPDSARVDVVLRPAD